MKVLMITGDRRFGPGNPRYEIQRQAVEELAVLYWGPGSWWPKIPRGSFDAITAQDPLLRGAFGRRVANKVGARLNMQVHMDLQSLSWWKRVFAQIQLRHADSVRVVSQKIKEQVKKMGVRAPITVLPVYIDIERFKAVVRQPHPTKTILWVGRFEQEKDPLYAVSVLEKVREAGIEANLVMLGAGSLMSQLKNRGRPLLVEFPGWQDTAAYLAKADVVLSTSLHESYGASMIEALAAGVPVVASDVGVAKEAGAVVKARSDLALGVVEVLQSGTRGELKLHLLSEKEWAHKWRETLL